MAGDVIAHILHQLFQLGACRKREGSELGCEAPEGPSTSYLSPSVLPGSQRGFTPATVKAGDLLLPAVIRGPECTHFSNALARASGALRNMPGYSQVFFKDWEWNTGPRYTRELSYC